MVSTGTGQGQQGVITASLKIPVPGPGGGVGVGVGSLGPLGPLGHPAGPGTAFALSVDDSDIPYIEDGVQDGGIASSGRHQVTVGQ